MNFVSKQYALILTTCCLIGLIFIGLFQSLVIYAGNGSSIVNQTGLQRYRDQKFAKDAVLLAYPDPDISSNALNEMQITLPAFEQTEKGLLVGDPSLGLPNNVSEDIVQAVQVNQIHFVTIDAAVKRLIANPRETADVRIILDHEVDFANQMTVINNLWITRINQGFLHLFLIELSLTAIVFILVLAKYAFITRHLFERNAS